MKTVIVGGVAGGASTGARLRRLDESAEIVVLERDHYVCKTYNRDEVVLFFTSWTTYLVSKVVV